MNGLKGIRILFVDDNKFEMRPTVDALIAHGAQVEFCVDGTEALEYLRNHKSDLPDLIVLDVMMSPGKEIEDQDGGRSTGLRLFQKIRQDFGRQLKIVISTVKTDATVRVFRGDPCVRLLTKPYLFGPLHDAITQLLSLQPTH